MNTTTARQTVIATLAAIGVDIPARLVVVKGGRVTKVFLPTGTTAAQVAQVAELIPGVRLVLDGLTIAR